MLFRFFQLLICGLLTKQVVFAQNTLESAGYRIYNLEYDGFPVDCVVKSKKGDESKRKPVFFFAQGSLPRPIFVEEDSSL